MALGVKQMMEAANAAVPKITPAEAREKIAKGNALLLDIRDGTEVQASGKAAGAVHVSRGLLEFRADARPERINSVLPGIDHSGAAAALAYD